MISHVLLPGPDGTAPEGDPTSRGSATPTGHDLVLDTELSVYGGDPDRVAPRDGDGGPLPERVTALVDGGAG